MNKAYKCPKCGGYVIGEYCFICQVDIRNYLFDNPEILDILKDIVGENNE